MNNASGKGQRGNLLLAILPFFSVFPALLLILLGLSGPVSGWFVDSQGDAETLLRACRNMGVLLCLLAAAGLFITVLSIVFSIRTLMAREGGRALAGSALKLGGIVLLLEGLLYGAMLVKGPVFSVIADAQADLRQIQSGELEEKVLWLYPGSAPAHLPGPYGAGDPTPLTKYYAADDSLQSWDPYLFPNGLGFAAEPGKVYTSSKPKEWNEENVPRYEITCTSRLRFVVNVVQAGG